MNLVKALIVDKSGTKYKIRIPVMHGLSGSLSSTSDSDLPLATVCSVPGQSFSFKKDDIVYVYFENDMTTQPVIMGSLYKEETTLLPQNNKLEDFNISQTLSTLDVKDKVTLPKDTSIGSVTSKEISFLSGLNKNIQLQLDNISTTKTEYSTLYSLKEYQQLNQWKLNTRGLLLNSGLVDDDEQNINTYDYVRTKNLENSILSGDASKTFTDDSGASHTAYYTDGYNKDARMRQNWMGAESVQNDTVKFQSGLYARNFWGVSHTLDNGTYKWLSEYTFRPTIQSYVKKNSLTQSDVDHYPVQQYTSISDNTRNYSDNWLPYFLNINPDGGDVYFGRGGYMRYIDEDVPQGTNPETYTQTQALYLNNIYITSDGNKLYQQVGRNGSPKQLGSGSGASYFIYQKDDDSDTFVTPFLAYGQQNTFVRRGLFADNPEGTDFSKLKSGFVTFRVEIILNIIDTTLKRITTDTVYKSGKNYYTLSGSTYTLLTPGVDYTIGQTITGTIYTDTIYVSPVTAEQTMQLGTIMSCEEDSGDSPILVDLSNDVGYKFNNIEMHFMAEVVPDVDQENDTISLSIKNAGNYLTFTNLQNSNIIQLYKGQLNSTLFVQNNTIYIDSDMTHELLVDYTISGNIATIDGVQYTIVNNTISGYQATFNISAYYTAVDVDNVSIATITTIGSDDYTEQS